MYQTMRRKGLYIRCTEIRCSKKRLNLKIALAVSGLLLGISHGVWAQQLYRGEAIYVGNPVVNACEYLPVFSRPEIKAGASNRPDRYLSFGDLVTVESREKKYEVADSYPSSKKRQIRAQAGGSSRTDDEDVSDLANKNFYERYEWIGISGGGYVAANCLVHESLFGKQKKKREPEALTLQGAAGKAKKKKQAQASTCASDANTALTLQGAAGKSKKKKQGQTCVQGFDEYLLALPPLEIFSDELEEFLREGKLGDFAG